MDHTSSLNPENRPPQSDRSRQKHAFAGDSLLFVLVRIGIFLVLSTAITFVMQWLLAGLLGPGRSLFSPKNLAIADGTSLAGVFAAALVMSRLEERSFYEYGLPARAAFGKRFWQGALFGLIEISAVIGIIAVLGAYH